MVISKSPKVSVLTPIYNTKIEYLKEAIESILSQTFKDFEYLLLNDSPDNTEIDKCVLAYQKKDKRIKYFKNERNMGRPFSRNRLIDLSKGEYLDIFDSDDISLPTRLKKEVKYLDENPDIGVVSALNQSFGDESIISSLPEFDFDIKVTLSHHCCICNPCSMIRKSVLIDNNIRYNSSYLSSQDYRLWVDLVPFTNFHNIQEVLLLYRVHSDNTVKRTDRDIYLRRVSTIISDMRNKYPAHWEEYQRRYIKKEPKKFRVRLFNIIPLLKVKNNWVYLFEIIPLFKIKF